MDSVDKTLLPCVYWLKVLSEDIVMRLFSRSWVVREYGLRMLSRDAVTMLLLGVGEGRSGVQVSAERQHNTHLVLECCFSVLSHMIADRVYRVFIAALVCAHLCSWIITWTVSRGSAAAAPLPFRFGDPAVCGSHPLVTPYYCRLHM